MNDLVTNDLALAIRNEILKAIGLLGGDAELLASLEDAPKEELSRAAEQLNADRYLLDVLSNLREWTAGEEAEIAKAFKKAQRGRVPIIPPAKG